MTSMLGVFYIINTILYIFIFMLGLNFIFDRIKEKNKRKHPDTEVVSLYIVRSLFYKEDFDPIKCYIAESKLEFLNMFITLAPEYLSTLNKIEKQLLKVSELAKKKFVSVDMLYDKLNTIEESIDQLTEANGQIIYYVEPMYIESETHKQKKVELDHEMCAIYVDLVNQLMEITDHHQIVSYEIYRAFDETSHGDLIDIYKRISMKIIYILYNAVMGYVEAIEKEIFVEIIHQQ